MPERDTGIMRGNAENPSRSTALSIVSVLRDAGFDAYWAGGCVRDMLLGRTPKDYDVATSALPDNIINLFAKTIPVGAAFGVIEVVQDEHNVEVATFRRDIDTADGRHPASVEFCGPEEDAKRRDFTINGLFYDPIEDKVLDFVGGRRDLDAKRIRAIGSPSERFREDYLRMLRAVRFSSVLEFPIEKDTADAIRAHAPSIHRVSAERMRDELLRLLTESPHAGNGINLMLELGLLKEILPEIAAMVGQEQPEEFHPEGDVYTHTVQMLNAMDNNPSPTLALSVLLHDVGKPPTAETVTSEEGKERIRFYGHAGAGAEIAENILRRLRCSNKVIETVTHSVGNHMRFMNVQEMRMSKLRAMAGAPAFEEELELHRLDCLCSHGSLDNYEFLRDFVKQLRNEPVLPAPWITGGDILKLGIPEGPEVGKWHRKAYEAQLENQCKDREALLEWLRAELAKIDGE